MWGSLRLTPITFLDDAEPLELVEFDPTVNPKEPPKPIVTFLEKHFNRSLPDDERESIMKDFPSPIAASLQLWMSK